MKVVFDTYAWIEYFEGTKKGEIVERYLNESEIITPSIVLLELSYKANKKGWDMKKCLSFIKIKSDIVGINEQYILEFGKTYNTARSKIKNFGMVDAFILTASRLNKAQILTGDHHFSSFENSIILD